MGTVTLTYKGSFKPTKTEHLSSEEISLQCEIDVEIEDADMVNEKAIRTEFEKLMGTQLKTQSAALDTWLVEKNAVVTKLVGLVDKLGKAGPPIGDSAGEYEKLSKEIRQIARSADLEKGADDLKAEYTRIVADWAQNFEDQQPLVVIESAIKKASIKNWKNKKLRVRAFKIAKAVLVVGVAVAGVVACVASLGTLTPAVAALTVALVAISGFMSLKQTGADLKSIWDMEKRLLEQVESDLSDLAKMLAQVQQVSSPFAKHAADLRNYSREREARVKKLTVELQKLEAESKGIAVALTELEKSDPTGGWRSELSKRRKSAAECQKLIDETTAKLAEAKKGAQHALALFDWMEALGTNVARVTAVPPSSMSQNIKQYISSADGVLDAANLIGGVVGAAMAVSA